MFSFCQRENVPPSLFPAAVFLLKSTGMKKSWTPGMWRKAMRLRIVGVEQIWATQREKESGNFSEQTVFQAVWYKMKQRVITGKEVECVFFAVSILHFNQKRKAIFSLINYQKLSANVFLLSWFYSSWEVTSTNGHTKNRNKLKCFNQFLFRCFRNCIQVMFLDLA